MTREQAIEEVESIKEQGREDPESAHWREDALHERFIEEIANGFYLGNEQQCIEVAKEILKTRDLDFPRRCA